MTESRDPRQVIRAGRSEQSDPTNLLGCLGFSPPRVWGQEQGAHAAVGPLKVRAEG